MIEVKTRPGAGEVPLNFWFKRTRTRRALPVPEKLILKTNCYALNSKHISSGIQASARFE